MHKGVQALSWRVADCGIRMIFWREYPSLWSEGGQGHGVVFPRFALITSCFLFSGLQNGVATKFFEDFAVEGVTESSAAAILGFRGSPPLG
jgi:hypothetical protein